jgi:hypothetical protein
VGVKAPASTTGAGVVCDRPNKIESQQLLSLMVMIRRSLRPLPSPSLTIETIFHNLNHTHFSYYFEKKSYYSWYFLKDKRKTKGGSIF